MPIIGLDVWEHAYYPDDQNQKTKFFREFFKICNWQKAEERYLKHK